jgi:hypothetical protein
MGSKLSLCLALHLFRYLSPRPLALFPALSLPLPRSATNPNPLSLFLRQLPESSTVPGSILSLYQRLSNLANDISLALSMSFPQEEHCMEHDTACEDDHAKDEIKRPKTTVMSFKPCQRCLALFISRPLARSLNLAHLIDLSLYVPPLFSLFIPTRYISFSLALPFPLPRFLSLSPSLAFSLTLTHSIALSLAKGLVHEKEIKKTGMSFKPCERCLALGPPSKPYLPLLKRDPFSPSLACPLSLYMLLALPLSRSLPPSLSLSLSLVRFTI